MSSSIRTECRFPFLFSSSKIKEIKGSDSSLVKVNWNRKLKHIVLTNFNEDDIIAHIKIRRKCGIVKLGVQELLSLGLLSSSTKDKLSRSPLDPWSLKL